MQKREVSRPGHFSIDYVRTLKKIEKQIRPLMYIQTVKPKTSYN